MGARTLITGITALLLATGTAHAEDSISLGMWNCPGLGKVEFRKFMLHELGFAIKGNQVNLDQLYGTITEDGGTRVTFKNKHCREVK
jgi:hypothetical protein